jgi:hypothetical protein
MWASNYAQLVTPTRPLARVSLKLDVNFGFSIGLFSFLELCVMTLCSLLAG